MVTPPIMLSLGARLALSRDSQYSQIPVTARGVYLLSWWGFPSSLSPTVIHEPDRYLALHEFCEPVPEAVAVRRRNQPFVAFPMHGFSTLAYSS